MNKQHLNTSLCVFENTYELASCYDPPSLPFRLSFTPLLSRNGPLYSYCMDVNNPFRPMAFTGGTIQLPLLFRLFGGDCMDQL